MGGAFTVPGQPISNLGVFDKQSGVVRLWAPSPNAAVESLVATSAGNLLVAGRFTSISGIQARGIALVDCNSAETEPSFVLNPTPGVGGANVHAAILTTGRMELGGSFVGIGTQSVNFLARTHAPLEVQTLLLPDALEGTTYNSGPLSASPVPVSWALLYSPSWLSMQSSVTGNMTGLPPLGAPSPAVIRVACTETGGLGRTAHRTYHVPVLRLPTVSVLASQFQEGNGRYKTPNPIFTFELSRVSATDVDVWFTLQEGTAKFGTEFAVVDTHVVIRAGHTTATAAFLLFGDTYPESNMHFTVRIDSVSSNASVGTAQAVIQIVDDDTLLPPVTPSPVDAFPASIRVLEAPAQPADSQHILAAQPYFAWDFASDIPNETQGSWRVVVSSDAAFSLSGMLWDSGKVTGGLSQVQHGSIGTALPLIRGTDYWLGVQLWSSSNQQGPLTVIRIRSNSNPVVIADTGRLPADSSQIPSIPPLRSSTPTLHFVSPGDGDGDGLHFKAQIDTDPAFGSGNLKVLESFSGNFEYSLDGQTWFSLENDGCPAAAGIKIRLNIPFSSHLGDGTWYWRLLNTDGFEVSSWSSTWQFVIDREYSFSGTLFDGVTPVTGVDVAVLRNGVRLAGVAPVSLGQFQFVTDEDLQLGDVLVFYVEGNAGADRAALITTFPGSGFTGIAGPTAPAVMKLNTIIVDPRTSGGVDLGAFEAQGAATQWLPWQKTGSDVVLAPVPAPCELLVFGRLKIDGIFNATSFAIHVAVDSSLIVDVGKRISAEKFVVSGEISFEQNSAAEIGSGGMDVSNRITMQGASLVALVPSVQVRVLAGVAHLQDALIIGGPGGITFKIQGGSATLADVVFDNGKLEAGPLGTILRADDLTFSNQPLGPCILWQTEQAASTAELLRPSFAQAPTAAPVSPGDPANIEASSTARPLAVRRSTGPGCGPTFENDPAGLVTPPGVVNWIAEAPAGFHALPGDTRLLLLWDSDEQTPSPEYNVYTSQSPAGPWILVNAQPLTIPYLVASGLQNNVEYFFYVTLLANGVETGPSPTVSVSPRVAGALLVVPATADSGSTVPITLIGSNTHWTKDLGSPTSVSLPSGGQIVTGSTLCLGNTLIVATLEAGATPMSTQIEVSTNNIWAAYGVTGYSEFLTAPFDVSYSEGEVSPSITWTTPTAESDTSGAFSLQLLFDRQGGSAVESGSLEILADVDIESGGQVIPAGQSLASIFDLVTATGANAQVEQTPPSPPNPTDQVFPAGEITLMARVTNLAGKKSPWKLHHFYCEAARPGVAVARGVLVQGRNNQLVTITGSFSSPPASIVFTTPGAGLSAIQIVPISATSAQATVNAAVDCAVGDVEFELYDSSIQLVGQGKVKVKSIMYAEQAPLGGYTGSFDDLWPTNPVVCAVNVFVQDGSFFTQDTDIGLQTGVMPITISRTYRSRNDFASPFGVGWSSFYTQRIWYNSSLPNSIVWRMPDGRAVQLTRNGVGVYESPNGVYVLGSLNERGTPTNGDDDEFTLIDPNGCRSIFSAKTGLLKAIREGYDNQVTLEWDELTYQIKWIAPVATTPRADSEPANVLRFYYNDRGYISRIEDRMWGVSGNPASVGTTRSVEYEYSSGIAGLYLVRQFAPTTDRYSASNRIHRRYQYGAVGTKYLLTELFHPAEASGGTPYLKNEYEAPEGRIMRQEYGGSGSVFDIVYDWSATHTRKCMVLSPERTRTDYTINTIDPGNGNKPSVSVDKYNGQWNPPQVGSSNPVLVSGTIATPHQQPGMWRVLTFYNSDFQPKKIEYPKGNTLQYLYNSDGNGSPIYSGNMALESFTFEQEPVYQYSIGQVFARFVVSGIVGLPNGEEGLTVCVEELGSSNRKWWYPVYSVGDNAGMSAITALLPVGGEASSGLQETQTYLIRLFRYPPDPLSRSRLRELRVTAPGMTDLLTKYSYDVRNGLLVREEGPDGVVTRYNMLKPSEEDGIYPTKTERRRSGPAGKSPNDPISSSIRDGRTGQPLSEVDEGGIQTTFDYGPPGYSAAADGAGFARLKSRTVGSAFPNRTETYLYDTGGNIRKVIPPIEAGEQEDDVATEYLYNELNQVARVKLPVAVEFNNNKFHPLEYRYYDKNGNVSHVFREYITWDGRRPAQPANPLSEPNPASLFSGLKSAQAMEPTWVETRYEYDVLNRQTLVVQDAVAGSSIIRNGSVSNYDKDGLVSSSVTAAGVRTEFTYDERGKVIFVKEGADDASISGKKHFRYDGNGNLSHIYDELANDGDWELAASAQPAGRVTIQEYDGFDRLVKIIDPQRHYVSMTYNTRGQLEYRRAFSINASKMAEEHFIYDVYGRQNQADTLALQAKGPPLPQAPTPVDPGSPYGEPMPGAGTDGSRHTSLVHDRGGRVTKRFLVGTSGYLIHVSSYEPNQGDLTWEWSDGDYISYGLTRDGRPLVTSYGRAEVEDDSLLSATVHSSERFVYNAARQVVEHIDRRNKTTTRVYDGFGRVVQETDANGNLTKYAYDLIGRLVRREHRNDSSVQSKTIISTYQYDEDSRELVAGYVEAGSGTISTTLVERTYDKRGRLSTLKRPGNRIYEYRYDVASNVTQFRDALSDVIINYKYDKRNLLQQRNISTGEGVRGASIETYVFDALGRLTKAANFDGPRRISSVNWYYNSLGQAEIQQEYYFDRNGNQISVHFSNPVGTAVNASTRDFFQTTMRFDTAGLVGDIEYWDGSVVSNSFDKSRLTESASPQMRFSASYKYVDGLLDRREFGNGLATKFVYDGTKTLLHDIVHLGFGSSGASDENRPALWQLYRRYDSVGNVTSEWRSHLGDGGKVFRFDQGNRLIESSVADFGVSLTTSTTQLDIYANPSHSGGNKAVTSYLFDSRGNRLSQIVSFKNNPPTVTQFRRVDYNINSSTPDFELGLYNSITTDQSVTEAFSYDRGELMQLDPTAARLTEFDYRGQLTEVRTPTQLLVEAYGHDVLGRRCIELHNPANSTTPAYREDDATLIVHHVGMADAPRLGDNPISEIGISLSSGTVSNGKITVEAVSAVHYVNGLGASGPGSMNAVHPLSGAVPATGSTPFNVRVYEFVAYRTADPFTEFPPPDTSAFGRYRHEDHLGSLVGTTDEQGRRMAQYDYLDYGTPVRRDVSFDGAAYRRNGTLNRSSVSKGTRQVVAGVSTRDTTLIRIAPGSPLKSRALIGHELCIADYHDPESNQADNQLTATVLSNTDELIEIDDPQFRVYDALTNQTWQTDFVIHDMPEGVQRGQWLTTANLNIPAFGGQVTELRAGYSVTTPQISSGPLYPFTTDYVGAATVYFSDRDNVGHAVVGVGEQLPGQLLYNVLYVSGWHSEATPTSSGGVQSSKVYQNDHYRVEIFKVEDRATQSGTWDVTPSIVGGVTSLKVRDHQGHFEPFQDNWLLQPDVTIPFYVPAQVFSATELRVTGDIREIANASGERFRLHAPPGTNGRLRRGGARARMAVVESSRHLFAGYRYDCPTFGVFGGNFGPFTSVISASAVIASRQLGKNLQGQYNCMHREFDPNLGRFIAPDPLLTPFWNPTEYAANNPLSLTDPTGLSVLGDIGTGLRDAVRWGDKKLDQFYKWGTTPLPPGQDTSDYVHLILQGAGMFPVVGEFFDAVDLGLYLVEGKYTDAAISAAAMLPMIGMAATAGRWGKTAANVARKAESLRGLPRGGFGLKTVVRSLDEAAQGAADFKSGKDVMKRVLGPAWKSHPYEYDAWIRFAKEMGAELDISNPLRPAGTLAYNAGKKGQGAGMVILDADASISAVRHEMGHLIDDAERGFPGYSFYYDPANKGVLWAMERLQYVREIKFARSLGYRKEAQELIRIARDRRFEILSR